MPRRQTKVEVWVISLEGIRESRAMMHIASLRHRRRRLAMHRSHVVASFLRALSIHSNKENYKTTH
jgi:hypothetical protein